MFVNSIYIYIIAGQESCQNSVIDNFLVKTRGNWQNPVKTQNTEIDKNPVKKC